MERKRRQYFDMQSLHYYTSSMEKRGNFAVCVKIQYTIRQVLISKKRNPKFPPHIKRQRKMRLISFLGCLDPDGEAISSLFS
eukprot:12418615-Ditylum_brightwellii.AAC.1